MNNLPKLFGRRIFFSVFGGILFFIGFLFLYKSFNFSSLERQNIKSMVAKTTIGCLRAKKQNESMDCRAVIENIDDEVAEVKFQVWVLSEQGVLLWKNTDAAPPQIDSSFMASGHAYTPIEKKKKLFPLRLVVPNGYVDDEITHARVIVGAPLSGNNFPYLRNRILLLVFALFIFGILLSSTFSFWMFSSRANEAKRILKSFKAGDLSARFRESGLDELSELSSSFNEMVDLLASALSEVKESEESRRALVSELSHDLRTPLTSMTSFLQLLQSPNLSEELKTECLSSISSEIAYLNQLVTSLFELSQIDSPQTKTNRVFLDLSPILKGLENDFALACKTGKVRFIAKISDEKLSILGDSVLVKRMLGNMIDNSMRHAKSMVLLKASRVANEKIPGRSEIEIEIIDDGQGFSEATLQSFGKASATRNLDRGAGSMIHVGLGSVIASKIAKVFGGNIAIQNNESGGAKITIRLPLT